MSTERHDHDTSDEPGDATGRDTGGTAFTGATAAPDGGALREHSRDRPGRRSRATVVAVAAAVLLAGGGGAWWASASGGGSGGTQGTQSAPQPLHLDGPALVASGGATTPADDGDTYRLTGILPSGPASAAVYPAAPHVDQSAVQRLATALGVSGTPATVGDAWRVGGGAADGGGPALLAGKDAPGSWVYSRFGPPTASRPGHVIRPLDGGDSGGAGNSGSPGSAAGDGTADGSGAGSTSRSDTADGAPGALTDATAPVGEEQALAAARPVLAALGLSGARTDASQTVGALRVVEADPMVGGLPTHGWATTIQVGADGRITSANGRLAALSKGTTYPVVTAAKALAELNARALERPGGPASCERTAPPMTPPAPGTAPGTGGADPGGSVPCVPPRHQVEVRGAVFGLSTQYVNGAPTLVPSWLFSTAQPGVKATAVIGQPAVDPTYVVGEGGASPVPVPPVTPINPGGPNRTPPGQPTDPRAPHPVKFTAYHAKGTTLTVTFWGGLCGTYKAAADETATQVRVAVTETPAAPGKVCPMIEKTLTAQVTLRQPLGTRTVVDATSGQPVKGQ